MAEVARRYGIGKLRLVQLLEPGKTRARRAVAYAVKVGRLIPAESCNACSSSDFELVAHHEDYSYPLRVLWVCRACHRRIHAGSRIPAWGSIAANHKRAALARAGEWLCSCTACQHMRPKYLG